VQVIARGSSFRFRGDGVSLDSVGALLAVGYCVNGLIDVQDGQVEIRVELAETRSGTLMWSETFRAAGAGLRGLRQQIVTTLIVALDRYIPRHEAELAGLKGAGPLDAWSAYHLGLRHMHRITRRDNDIAKGWFARATALDPEFSSAYAAWSFCRFQDALTAYEPDHAHVLDDVRALAERSLTLDPDDPAAHFAMGRSHWMTSDPAQGLPWLDKAVTLDPNYAKAYYSRGMIRLLCGQSQASQADLAAAMALSPLDPLAFAMQGGMALSLAQEGDLDAAFHWATQAAQEPRAHHIGIMPAVAIAQLMGDAPAASRYLGLLLRRNPGATVAGFWEAMPHRDADFRATISTALIAAGLPEK
jgi:tetratricopeptide (TPR) repeat protein